MYVCVIGGANIDISGTPYKELKLRDSNPCHSTVSLGGVGRNIAENLGRLEVDVVLLTVLGDDKYASMIRANASELGMDMTHCLVADGNTSTYMCINDHEGDMFIAVSDMGILQYLTPEYLASKLDIINGAACVIADTNIPQCLQYLQDNVTVPLFIDTVSASKTQYIKDDLHNIHCLKPNVLEAEIISGIDIVDQVSLDSAIDIIHSKGVQWVMCTMGDKGVYYSDGKRRGNVPAYITSLVNTTGAGDSFVGGAVSAFINGADIVECAMQGCAVSSITISDSSTVSSHVTLERVKNIIREDNTI